MGPFYPDFPAFEGEDVGDDVLGIERDLWWLGAIIYITGSIMINFGSNVIRRDHSRQEEAGVKAPPYKRPIWALGKSLKIPGASE